TNRIFTLDRAALLANSDMRRTFFDGLQVMSSHFQRLMFARMALCDSDVYRPVFLEHFLEELGHDAELRRERGNASQRWDAVLEASASWFVGKNYLIDNPGRIVMIHLILERGASVFYSHFQQIFCGELQSAH